MLKAKMTIREEDKAMMAKGTSSAMPELDPGKPSVTEGCTTVDVEV